MLKDRPIIRESAHRVSEAANRTIGGLLDNRTEHEPSFTDRMLGRMEEAMTDYELKGVKWTAKTLTSSTVRSQETEYGPDFVGVLDVDINGYKVKKGYLVQSKMIEPDETVNTAEFTRMHSQCKKMLQITPASFVFLYSISGIFVAPAISVLAAGHVNPHTLYVKDIGTFFEMHFECFIGDQGLHSPSVDALDQLRGQVGARNALLLMLRETWGI